MKNWILSAGYLLSTLLFISCGESAENSVVEKKEKKINYYETGAEISAIAQAELMKSVRSALEKGGAPFAIKHCNVHATPLSDSLSKVFNCKIDRLALKNRNPTNYPQLPEEVSLLNNYLERSFDNKKLGDTLLAVNGKLMYYRPIFLGMETCLNCHGQVGKDISIETFAALNEQYPEDKATNYRLGEFRGAWKITFNLD